MKSTVSTDIYVRKGKIYVATVGDCEIADIVTDPIYTVSLSLDELTAAIEKVFRAGTPKLPRPLGDKLYNIPQPLLKVAKVTSWNKLAQGGTAYGVAWYPDKINISFTKLDRKGRFTMDVSKEINFPIGTNIKQIAQAILDDIHSRPELQG